MDVLPFARKGRFWRGNLHTHSTRSDGRLPPQAVADFYKGAGYDFLALTDHFWESCGYPITDTRALRSKSFTTLIGAEIHAPLTAKGHDWHIVALGLPFDFAPPASGETMQGMCRRAAAAGAFLGIAHPQWYGLTVEDALSIPRGARRRGLQSRLRGGERARRRLGGARRGAGARAHASMPTRRTMRISARRMPAAAG